MEWIITNGLGGYASQDDGANTRKYHGLLIASKKPPGERRVLVNELVDVFQGEPVEYKLVWDKQPVLVHESEGLRIVKKASMVFEQNTTIIDYDVKSRKKDFLTIRPYITNRSLHGLAKNKNDVRPEGVHIGCDACPLIKEESWKQLFYKKEEERGYDSVEYCYSPGFFNIGVKDNKKFRIVLSEKETSNVKGNIIGLLDSFVVKRGAGKSIIAGYHWFTDWGRDTMISIPGLLLSRKKYGVVKKMLQVYANHLQDGLIPQLFTEDKGTDYKSIDSSLWFIRTIHKYSRLSKDDSFEQVARSIIDSYMRYADTDGLLVNPGLNTWMDTLHRSGKNVEVNALWYNCLKYYGNQLAKKVKKGFQKYWNKEEECLFDTVEPFDKTVRPNQLFAVGLEHSPLNKEQQKKVVQKTISELVTPYGLRSLSPKDPEYVKVYEGSVYSRDRAYHNGIVWPWLIGIFLDACSKTGLVYDKKVFVNSFKGFRIIPEIFDAEAPYTPRGCISQAWSAAELYRQGIIS